MRLSVARLHQRLKMRSPPPYHSPGGSLLSFNPNELYMILPPKRQNTDSIQSWEDILRKYNNTRPFS
jgi:hypothetical protein